MFDIGIVVGKFAPLTLGHINLITAASTQAKKVIVVLSHDQRWVDAQNPRDRKALSFKNRLRWLQQIYADTEHVEIKYIIEDDIPAFPNGWEEYSKLLMDVIISENIKQMSHQGKDAVTFDRPKVAIFSSELGYDVNYARYLPLVEHVVVDSERTQVPISATKIRESLYKYWEYLPSIVRKDFTKKVCVIGTESSGKTTLVKNMAKLLNTSWVEEYGRTYCETVLAGSEETLRSDDYPLIAYRQKELEEVAMRAANRVCIVDTNAFVTEFYHRLYEGQSNEIVSAIARSEHYDLVIILEPTVPWVDDGLRINSDRSKTSELFEHMLEEYPNAAPTGRTVRIKSSDFGQRLNQAMDAVRNYMADVNGGEITAGEITVELFHPHRYSPESLDTAIAKFNTRGWVAGEVEPEYHRYKNVMDMVVVDTANVGFKIKNLTKVANGIQGVIYPTGQKADFIRDNLNLENTHYGFAIRGVTVGNSNTLLDIVSIDFVNVGPQTNPVSPTQEINIKGIYK